ncbi:Bromodomain-containing protein, partial [Piptocephalis cylindrospora]
LTKEQTRYCLAIIRQLKRSTASEAFRAPVDHAGMGLADYLSVVKQPMDLGTVERKLSKGEYSGVGEFAADVQRIWDNCYLYNGRENYYSQQAQLLETTFHNHLRKMPQQALGSSSLEEVLPEKVLSPMGTSGSPLPKREIHPPTRDLPGEDFKYCQGIVREIFKASNRSTTWPFLAPVDWKALNLPDYPTIVKNPMDWGTIRKKLEAGEYSSAEAFEADARLIPTNCYSYNPPGSDVYVMAQELEKIFERKWAGLPAPVASRVTSPSSGSGDRRRHGSEDGSLEQLEKTLAKLSQELESYKSSGGSDDSGGPRSGAGQKKKRTPTSTGTKRKRAGEETLMEPTYEAKQALSRWVNDLPYEHLEGVLSIIREGMPSLVDGKDELELDLNLFDQRTFTRLYRYVEGIIKGKSTGRKRGVGARKKKKKNDGS